MRIYSGIAAVVFVLIEVVFDLVVFGGVFGRSDLNYEENNQNYAGEQKFEKNSLNALCEFNELSKLFAFRIACTESDDLIFCDRFF